jgi:hypothetical protein
MNNTLLSAKTVHRTAFVCIQSDLDTESLGRIISAHLIGGLPFGGLDEDIRDEIPAVYTQPILGCRLVLLGYPGEAGYTLVLEEGSVPYDVVKAQGTSAPRVDLSGNIYGCLKAIEGLSVSLD